MTILNQHTEFHYNPFAGVSQDDIHRILVPKFDMEALAAEIMQEQPLLVEFVGKKGRGKSTHLSFLHQIIPQYPLFSLNRGADFSSIIRHASSVILIDSIHHLNFFQRRQLFNQKQVVIYTCHRSKAWEQCFIGKQKKRFRFRGLSLELLKEIVRLRIGLAVKEPESEINLNEAALKRLLSTYKDDYRAIINALFDQFQPPWMSKSASY
ncbi:MAG: hypothetical protein R3B47_09870 [Bacteroidia bacterium]